MKHSLLVTLMLFAGGARADLTINGVEWTEANTLQVSILDGEAAAPAKPVVIDVPLADVDKVGQSGEYYAAVRRWPKGLITIFLSQDGRDLTSLYVLRQGADQQYEYANPLPILGGVAEAKDDLRDIMLGLRTWNQCTDDQSLEALVAWSAAWPGKQINIVQNEVGKGSVKKGENGRCAVIRTPVKAAPPAAKVAPAPKAKRPARPTPSAYDAYGNPIPSGYQTRDPYGGYDEYGRPTQSRQRPPATPGYGYPSAQPGYGGRQGYDSYGGGGGFGGY